MFFFFFFFFFFIICSLYPLLECLGHRLPFPRSTLLCKQVDAVGHQMSGGHVRVFFFFDCLGFFLFDPHSSFLSYPAFVVSATGANCTSA